jgi:hypothetical protein
VNIWTQERGNKAEEIFVTNKSITHILLKYNQSDKAKKNEMSRAYSTHERDCI